LIAFVSWCVNPHEQGALTMRPALRDCRTAVIRSIESNPYITKDVFETFISVVAAMCFLVQGFLSTQTELLISSGLLIRNVPDVEDLHDFQNHFVSVLYAGELIGNSSLYLGALYPLTRLFLHRRARKFYLC
jgi:hypothetical protein